MQIKVFFARRGVKFDRGVKISARQVNNLADDLTIESHLSVEAKEKLGTMDFKCVEANPRLIVHRRFQLFLCLFVFQYFSSNTLNCRLPIDFEYS